MILKSCHFVRWHKGKVGKNAMCDVLTLFLGRCKANIEDSRKLLVPTNK